MKQFNTPWLRLLFCGLFLYTTTAGRSQEEYHKKIEEIRVYCYAATSLEDSLNHFREMYRWVRKTPTVNRLNADSAVVRNLYRRLDEFAPEDQRMLHIMDGHFQIRSKDYLACLSACNAAFNIPNMSAEDSLYVISAQIFCFSELGMFGKSLEQNLVYNRIAERVSPKHLYNKWENLAIKYGLIGEYDEAIIAAKKQFEEGTTTEGYTLHQLVMDLNDIGYFFKQKGELDSALYYYAEGQRYLNIADSLEPDFKTSRRRTYTWGVLNGNTGQVYIAREEFDPAVPLLKSDISGSGLYNDYKNQASSWVALSQAYVGLNEKDSALQAVDSALALVSPKNCFHVWLKALKQKSRTLEFRGEFELALQVQNLFLHASDSARLAQEKLYGKALLVDIKDKENKQAILAAKTASELAIYQRNTTLIIGGFIACLLYTSPSPRDGATSRMPSSA